MKKNSQNGITLIILVITILVLLIISGVALSLITGQDGLISKTDDSSNNYNEKATIEKLKLALYQATMERFTNGLKDDELESFLVNNFGITMLDYDTVIVDKYVFKIDRENLVIGELLGNSNDVLIECYVSSQWAKLENAMATINGKILSANGNIITANITDEDGNIENLILNENNEFSVEVTKQGNYIIFAQNDQLNNNEGFKDVVVELKIDDELPTIETAKATISGSNINIQVSGNDKKGDEEQSGIDYYTYSITPISGVTNPEGTFNGNIDIQITDETKYTITITAVDKVGNESNEKVINVSSYKGLSITTNYDTWTNLENGPVQISISSNIYQDPNQYAIQYCINNDANWENYSNPIEVTNNGTTINMRVINLGDNSVVVDEIEYVVDYIDTVNPVYTSVSFSGTLNNPGKTTATANVTATINASDGDATDVSGSSGISEYEFSLNDGEWVSSTSKSKTYSNMKLSTSFKLKVRITDKAGNKIESNEMTVTPKSATTSIPTQSGSLKSSVIYSGLTTGTYSDQAGTSKLIHILDHNWGTFTYGSGRSKPVVGYTFSTPIYVYQWRTKYRGTQVVLQYLNSSNTWVTVNTNKTTGTTPEYGKDSGNIAITPSASSKKWRAYYNGLPTQTNWSIMVYDLNIWGYYLTFTVS